MFHTTSRFLYLIRHGQTPVNTRAVLHQVADGAELTAAGQAQMKAAADWLMSQKPRLKSIYCSTERRAEQSAGIVAQAFGKIPVHPEQQLGERRWGDWAGKTWTEVETVLEDFSLEDRYMFVPPQGESWAQFTERLQNVWWRLIAKTDQTEDIAIVTHGGVFRALVPEVLQLPLETSFMIQPMNGEVMTFELINHAADATARPEVIERTELNFIPHA